MIGNYDIIVVDPPTYSRALAEVKRAEPRPIASAIVTAMTALVTMMNEEETGCAICNDEDGYTFAPREPPPGILVLCAS